MGEGLGEAAVRILAALKEVRLEDSKETSEKHLHVDGPVLATAAGLPRTARLRQP